MSYLNLQIRQILYTFWSSKFLLILYLITVQHLTVGLLLGWVLIMEAVKIMSSSPSWHINMATMHAKIRSEWMFAAKTQKRKFPWLQILNTMPVLIQWMDFNVWNHSKVTWVIVLIMKFNSAVQVNPFAPFINMVNSYSVPPSPFY